MPPIPFPIAFVHCQSTHLSSTPVLAASQNRRTPSYTPNASSCHPLVSKTKLIGQLPYLARCFQSTAHSCDFVHMMHRAVTVKLGSIVEAFSQCKCHIHWELDRCS